MKIIRRGRPPAPVEKPWWHGKRQECSNCAAIYMLEKGDEVITHIESSSGKIRRVSFACPGCGRGDAMERPYELDHDFKRIDYPPNKVP